MLRIAVITNEPPPYRVPIFNRIAKMAGVKFQVIFCCRREPNRFWNLPPIEFDHVFLRERITTVNGRYIHNNPDVVAAIRRFAPDVVVTDGFNPTYLYAFAYAWIKGLVHIPMTDGTYDSERSLSWVHRAIRRFIYARSANFIAASDGGRQLYSSYGIPAERFYKSCLCIDNSAFTPSPDDPEKRYDFIFCGRIEQVKNPLFALQVAQEAAKRLGRRTSLLYVGSGSEEEGVRAAAAESQDVDVEFHGFATQQELPALYRSARIFLFPTLWDPWGVVANEACAAGLPVIVTPHAGAANELVQHGVNGYVCEPELDKWVELSVDLLSNPALYQQFSERSLSIVSHYTFEQAANGIVNACRAAMPAPRPRESSVESQL
ncbi:MAG: glycosyltransferase family 4 protein [Burkholderiaceae bacterium]